MGATAVTEVAIDSQERADSMISCCLAVNFCSVLAT
jgi:hypothetical protein